MADVYLGIEQIVGFQVQSAVDWRRRKAEQFPGDRWNRAAAAALNRLAVEITKLEGSELHQRIDALINLTHDANIYTTLNQEVSATLRNFDFHVSAESGATFLAWYYNELRQLSGVSNADISDPILAEHVESNEAVKAAKRVYKVASQRAYASAESDGEARITP
jgi:hypothetical protein